MRKIFLSLIILSVFIISPLGAFTTNAETSTSTDLQAKLDLLTKLNAQIKALQDQIISLTKEIQATQQQQGLSIIDLLRTLKQGSQGDDVKILQAILAADATIYPEGIISGYFGPATYRAVIKFQLKNGFEGVGNVGPKTLHKLQEELGKMPLFLVNVDGVKRLCAMVPPGHLIAPGWLRKQGGILPIVPDCQILPGGIQQKIDGGFPSDKTAPVITSIITSNIVSTSAVVNWVTDEAATSKVYYSTSSSVSFSTSSTASNSEKVKNHWISLTSLVPNTTYYYVVESKDAAGNTSTSSTQQFTTIPADVTAPTISSVAALNITASSAGINWTTNESATSKIYYSTSSTVSFATSSTVINTNLVTSHSLSITGLNSNTVYYYVVESKDVAGNTATSTAQQFTTAVVDTVAPIISAVAASSITTTTATVAWGTNEPSTSKVYYSTSTPVNTTTATTLTDASLISSHSLNLTGLSLGTTYYYVVESKDGSNNTAQSADQTFTTLFDTTAPVISGISISSLTSSNATVNWMTNELSTSKVYYSTSTPINLATAFSVSSTTSVTNHSLNLSGLSATTTYYFVIESKDASNNTATTTEQQVSTI